MAYCNDFTKDCVCVCVCVLVKSSFIAKEGYGYLDNQDKIILQISTFV